MKITINRQEALSLAKSAESIAPSKAAMDELMDQVIKLQPAAE